MKKNNRCFLSITVALMTGGLFSACLDIPSPPKDTAKITSVNVFAKQFDKAIETPIKLNSSEEAELIAEVTPSKHKKDVQYYWYNGEEILDSGATYTVPTSYMDSSFISQNFIPDRLVIEDHEGNTLETSFHVTVNNPPQLLAETTPADGDTLYGNSYTPILFTWQSFDRDENNYLNNTLEIDGVRYNVGDLQEVMQSGFTEGRHTFRIFVEDSMGDQDSSATQEFFVIDTLGLGAKWQSIL